MRISFTEPVSPRYIHINPRTNRVHLMVPVVGGQEISTDNTCQAKVELKAFFDGGAWYALEAYKHALEFDIQLLNLMDKENPQRTFKESRLAQIHVYMDAVKAMRFSYGDALKTLLNKPTNLYSIQLRPFIQDSSSSVVNPAFTIERKNDGRGIPLSPLFKELYKQFSKVSIAPRDPRTAVIAASVAALPAAPDLADLQNVLREQCRGLFGLTIDFRKGIDGKVINKAAIDVLMGFDEEAASITEYIEALLGMCAPNLRENIDLMGHSTPSLFYSIPKETPAEERTERLSIITQFFLAHLTIYCKARGISTQNFGVCLDKSPALSNALVTVLAGALSAGNEVEEQLFTFFNTHLKEFGLIHPLNKRDQLAIKQKCERTYRTVTATKENPHMDDFLILDKEVRGERAKFATHKGCLCVDFAEIADPFLANQEYFSVIRKDFLGYPIEIPHKNEFIAAELDIDIGTLLGRINEYQFEKLPPALKSACMGHPCYYLRRFLHEVAQGKQAEAQATLSLRLPHAQMVLQTPGVFTDYSGRTFHCTAYEYAYWAKDTNMCRMLECYMDERTKAQMLARINRMECTDPVTGGAVGLIYQQNGSAHRSAHFDFFTLKFALKRFVDGVKNWTAAHNWTALDAAWMAVGKAQRDVPAYVAQEYCRSDRSVYPLPKFNETPLPRCLTIYNCNIGAEDSWFPLQSPTAGLGYEFACWVRPSGTAAGYTCLSGHAVSVDLAFICRIDEVNTVESIRSRERLQTWKGTPSIPIAHSIRL